MGFGAVITRGDDFTVVEDIMPWIVEARVEMELSKPAKFALRFEDDLCEGDPEVAENDALRANEMIGVFVSVDNALHCLVFGPITRIKTSSTTGGTGSWIEVHGEDRRAIMGRIEQQVSWTGRASDAARAILSAWSIPAKVEDTLKDYKDSKNGLSQRATDLAFIEDIARKNLLEFWLDYGPVATKPDGKLDCPYLARLESSPPAGTMPAPVPALVPEGDYIIDLHPPPDKCVGVTRFDAKVDFERPNAAKGFAQSAETGKELEAPKEEPVEPLSPDWDKMDEAGGKVTRTAVAPAEATDDEEQGLAARAMLLEASWFVEVDCSTTLEMIQFCVKPHMIIDVQHAGTRLSGAYQVKSATHVINAADHFIDFKLRANGLPAPKGTA